MNTENNWVDSSNELPESGKPVLLKIDGETQNFTFSLCEVGTEKFFELHMFESEIFFLVGGGQKLEWMNIPK